mgnify:CR=1 FL=1
METIHAKIISMLLLGGISLFLGMLPVLLKRCCNIGHSATPKGQMLISALSCFGGGVILTTCFTHMLPEVNLFLNLNIEKGQFPDTGKAQRTYEMVILTTRFGEFSRTFSLLLLTEKKCGKIQIEIAKMSKIVGN